MQFPIRFPGLIEIPNRTGATTGLVLGVSIAALLFGVVFSSRFFSSANWPENTGDKRSSEISSAGSLVADAGDTKSASDVAETYSVIIRQPSGPPKVDTGVKDIHGNAVTTSCSTCHTSREPNLDNKTSRDLNEFHVGLALNHGSISCLSCHNPNNYDALKLADGTEVGYPDVMQLCAQCHGPQMRDYEHNAHGGFRGYWDLGKGDQLKNNCIDCHDPHLPQFPKMQPTFKPRDRFLDNSTRH